MLEPDSKLDFVAPEVKPVVAMMRVADEKSTNSGTESRPSLWQPQQQMHSPTHHIGPFHRPIQSSTMTIAALEVELQCAHEELKEVKEQLVASETSKARALRDYTNMKTLLDQISLVEHFAASDDVEVETAPLPPNWSDKEQGIATEIDRLRNELEASRNLNSKFATELDKAKQEIDGANERSTSFELLMETSRLQSEVEVQQDQQQRLSMELENAKKDIRTLQATLSDAWSHQGTYALDLARAKEEITWLEADLDAAQSLTVELAHVKDDIHILQGELDMARRLQQSSSNELLEVQEETSRLRNEHAASSGLTFANTALRTNLEELRVAHEASTTELQQEISALQADYEASILDSTNAKEEVCRLQGELTAKGREFAIMLRATEEDGQELRTKLEEVIGQYYNTCTELGEVTRQNDILRKECETMHVKYKSCSSELFRVKEEVFRHDVEHLASHEDLLTDINIAQEENSKLQAEVAMLKDERNNLSGELIQVREESHQMEMHHYSTCSELYKDIARLQSELAALEGQHGACSKELDRVRDVYQLELTQVQEIHDFVVAELIHANDEVHRLQLDSTIEFERSLEVVRSLKEEISRVQMDLSTQYSALMVDKSLTEKKMEELNLEFLATSARLQEVIATQKNAETELLEVITKEATTTSTLRADLEAVRNELVMAREAECKLQVITLDLEEMRAQMAFHNQSMETTTLVSELRVSMDALRSELDATNKSEAKYRETVKSLQVRIEDLERHLYESRDLEGKAKEALVLMSSDLQKVSIELAIAKEALEWVGGDNAVLSGELAAKSAELEAKNAEVVSTKEREARAKEGEARAKAAFTEYSLKLQRMKLELEDASALTDKAKALELDLDEATAKLETMTESKKTLSTSMASLEAELKSAMAELVATREDHGIALAEKEEQYEQELNQMRTQWEVAVMAEAEDASFDVGQATKEAENARQEAEELQAHIDTLEAKLDMLQLEVEAAKASEDWAFSQMRLKTIPEYNEEIEEEGLEGSVSWEEFQSLKAKAKELQEVVNKRGAVEVAEVTAAKARESEMELRVESLEKELQICREELSEAINKCEEAEAAKFSCEAVLQAKQLELKKKSLSHLGHLDGNGNEIRNGGVHSMGKLVNDPRDDLQGSSSLRRNGSIYFEDSQSSSPSRSSFSFANFGSPGRSERSPLESSLVRQVSASQATPTSEERPRKLKFSYKIGQYFNRKKVV